MRAAFMSPAADDAENAQYSTVKREMIELIKRKNEKKKKKMLISVRKRNY